MACYVWVHPVDPGTIAVGKTDDLAKRLHSANHPTKATGEDWQFLLGLDGAKVEEDILKNFFHPPRGGKWGGNNREVFGPITEDQFGYLRWLFHSEHVTQTPHRAPPPRSSAVWTPANPSNRLPRPVVRDHSTPGLFDHMEEDDPATWYSDILDLPELTGDDWYTPPEILDRCRRVCDGFDLDPATHVYAQREVRAAHFYTKDDNGLVQPWFGRVWCNPPFSRWPEFAPKITSEWKRGEITDLFVLMPTRALGTQQVFGVISSCNALFTSYGRISFWGPLGEGSATDGQVICYFGKKAAQFATNMSDLGIVFEVSPHYKPPATPVRVKKRGRVETTLPVPKTGNKSWSSTVTNG